jgi:hypothetical protein
MKALYGFGLHKYSQDASRAAPKVAHCLMRFVVATVTASWNKNNAVFQ